MPLPERDVPTAPIPTDDAPTEPIPATDPPRADAETLDDYYVPEDGAPEQGDVYYDSKERRVYYYYGGRWNLRPALDDDDDYADGFDGASGPLISRRASVYPPVESITVLALTIALVLVVVAVLTAGSLTTSAKLGLLALLFGVIGGVGVVVQMFRYDADDSNDDDV